MIVTPCQDPANDPEDWFLEKDGKQYRDDPLLTEDEVQEIYAKLDGASAGVVDEAIHDAEAEAKRQALIRRRQARDKCHTECYLRTQCLGLALEDSTIEHGTWGGYYADEIIQIRTLRDSVD